MAYFMVFIAQFPVPAKLADTQQDLIICGPNESTTLKHYS